MTSRKHGDRNRKHLCHESLASYGWHMDEDGCWSLHARFTLEQGERIKKAVDAAMDDDLLSTEG